MSYIYQYAQGVRIANFSEIALPMDDQLKFKSEDIPAIIKRMKKYTDLPYVFVVDKTQVQKIIQIISTFKTTRSRCYPFAIFILPEVKLGSDPADIDLIKIKSTDASFLAEQITQYANSKFQFDANRLHVSSNSSLPETVDVVIIGAGITGLYAANRLKQNGISFCVLDKREMVGGIWSMYANTTSRVNTSEAAYRLKENPYRANRDHSATREILEDIAQVAAQVSEDLFLQTEVKDIKKTDTGYKISVTRDDAASVIQSKGVILAVNDRVGPPREVKWPNQSVFQGEIVTGTSDKAKYLDWRDKNVVIVGMGAFAIENTRTALEGGARHVTVLCRRHGTICPKIIDYLNFATPYDDDFRHDKKSNIRNMMYWKKLYDMSGATQPECWMGKVKHPGHTISVSDIWFIAHYLKKVRTITGEITGMHADKVVVNQGQPIDADIVVNCIGFERNASAAKVLSGYTETYNINYLDKNFMYLADAYIDDNAFNSFFGSSVLEMVKFYMEVYLKYFDSSQYETMLAFDGITRIPIEERKWTHYINGAETLIRNDPELRKTAWDQVNTRSRNFLEQHDLQTYIVENKREWRELHSLLVGRPMSEAECLPYVFEKLLQ